MVIYYEKLVVVPMCSNGSWRYGGHARTRISTERVGGRVMDVEQFGKTDEECRAKVMAFIGRGDIEVCEVGVDELKRTVKD